MSAKGRSLYRVALAIVFLVGAVLACCPAPSAGAVTVVIVSPGDGGTVVAGEAVMIDSTVTAVAGVDRVDLSVGGDVVRHDTPPEGNPTTFRVSQLWTPAEEGRATITVVAYDVNEVSGRATITLQVVATGGAVPTAEVGSPTEPGSTEVPEPTETPPPPVTTEAGCTLNSQYVADVTIPDGTVMSPGAGFVKTWRVRNSGTCDWEAGFELVFVSGEQMGGPGSVTLPAMAAGAETDVSVNLVAPSSYGVHKGTRRIRATDGTMFGTNLTVVIEVVSPATGTPTPTPTPTQEPTVEPTDAPTAGPTPVSIGPPASTLMALSPYTEEVEKEVTVAGGGEASVAVECPAGSVVVGGGYYSTDFGVVFNVQTKSGNGWRVYAVNTSGSSEVVRVYAICLHDTVGASTSVVYKQVTVKKNDSAGTVLHCPAGSIVTGGGWETEYVDVRVYASYPDLPGWSVKAYNRDSSDHPLHVYAVCVSGTGGVTTAFTSMYPVPSGAGGNVSVACPSKALITSGGFVAGTRGDLMVYLNGPKGTGNEWRVFTVNTAATVKDLIVYATCLGFP